MLRFLPRLAPALVLTALSAACGDHERKPIVYADPPKHAGGTGGTSDGAGGDGSGGTSPTGGTSGTSGGAPVATTGELEEVLADGKWSFADLRYFAGIAVDEDERVWVASEGGGLFVVEDGKDRSFATVAELTSTGLIDAAYVHDVEVDSDGHLYVLVPGAVLELTSDGSFEILREFGDTGDLHAFGAASRVHMAALDETTLWTITDADVMATYAGTDLGGSTKCHDVDLAMAEDGTALYSPGCVGSSLWILPGGSGEPVEIISGVEDLTKVPLGIQSYDCIAADPNGGFYVLTNDIEDGVHLFHLHSGVKRPSDLEEITVEGLDDTGVATALGASARCGMAASPDGSGLYIEHNKDLYRIAL